MTLKDKIKASMRYGYSYSFSEEELKEILNKGYELQKSENQWTHSYYIKEGTLRCYGVKNDGNSRDLDDSCILNIDQFASKYANTKFRIELDMP